MTLSAKRSTTVTVEIQVNGMTNGVLIAGDLTTNDITAAGLHFWIQSVNLFVC